MSQMKSGSMPKASKDATAAFQALLPRDPAVATRPMFGNMAAFVNGNMFSGLFGQALFVRLSEKEQALLIKQGGRQFEPMPGRAMTGYVCVPAGWQQEPKIARAWIARSLAWSRELAPKGPKAAKARKPARTARPPR